jgi:hypothetical protein
MGSVFTGVFVSITWFLIFIFRYFLNPILLKETNTNEMVGLILANFSVLYALLLGLLAVAAFQNLTEVSTAVTSEASSLGALYRDVQAYPQPTRGVLQNDLRDYTRFTIDRAWPDQQAGVVAAEGTQRITRFVLNLTEFRPSTKSEEIIHAEAYRQFNLYHTLLSDRLSAVSTGIPSLFWAVVIIGAIITILLFAMLEMNIVVHFVMAGLLSGYLGLVIFLVAAMDNPFRGTANVGSEPFEEVYQSLMAPDGAVMRSMSILLSDTAKYGRARIEGNEIVNGEKMPTLLFGKTRMNGFTEIVDNIKKNSGGVATLFAKSGDNFVRVTTNVKKEDGTRAIGTKLDPNGPALKHIRIGKPYYGETILFNKKYVAGYEPIQNEKYETIGLYFVGYLKPGSATQTNK